VFHNTTPDLQDQVQDQDRFSHPLYFAPTLKGLPLELGTGAWDQKTRMMGLPGRQKSLTITSAVWIHCTNVMDRQTDTAGHSKDRTYA